MKDFIGAVGRQRKFTLAVTFTGVSTVAFFMDKLTGDQFIAMAGVVLSLYSVANVSQRYVEAPK